MLRGVQQGQGKPRPKGQLDLGPKPKAFVDQVAVDRSIIIERDKSTPLNDDEDELDPAETDISNWVHFEDAEVAHRAAVSMTERRTDWTASPLLPEAKNT